MKVIAFIVGMAFAVLSTGCARTVVVPKATVAIQATDEAYGEAYAACQANLRTATYCQVGSHYVDLGAGTVAAGK